MKELQLGEVFIMLSVFALPVVLLIAIADLSVGQTEATTEVLKLIASI